MTDITCGRSLSDSSDKQTWEECAASCPGVPLCRRRLMKRLSAFPKGINYLSLSFCLLVATFTLCTMLVSDLLRLEKLTCAMKTAYIFAKRVSPLCEFYWLSGRKRRVSGGGLNSTVNCWRAWVDVSLQKLFFLDSLCAVAKIFEFIPIAGVDR